LAEPRSDIDKSGLAAMVVTELNEIAWLFNLKGEGEKLFQIENLT
jgi:hypothetical protein